MTQRFSSEFELQQVRLDPVRARGTGDHQPWQSCPLPAALERAFPAPCVPRHPRGFCLCHRLLGACWGGGRDAQGLSECSWGGVGVLHGLLETVGVLLEAAEIVLGGCQGASGAVRMVLGGVGGCWSGAGGSQSLLGCFWGLLVSCQRAAERCWGGAGVLTRVVRGCWGVPGRCRAVRGAAGIWQGLPGPRPACCSPICARQLEQFKEDNQDIGFGSGTRALEQALERTRANINWVKENREAVLAWFEEQNQISGA